MFQSMHSFTIQSFTKYLLKAGYILSNKLDAQNRKMNQRNKVLALTALGAYKDKIA